MNPFARPPAHLSREGRVRLIGEVAEALLAGKLPDRAAALFVGGALAAWLEQGGSLERYFLKVSAKAGSHQTASSIWRALKRETCSSRGGPGFEEGAMLATSSTDPKEGT